MDAALLIAAFFVIALLYASVGHGGASGYLAAMALFAVAPETLRPTALTLNAIVSTLGTIAFFHAGHFRAKLFWPFALSSLPFAYLGGSIRLEDTLFRLLLACALAFALLRLFMRPANNAPLRKPPPFLLVAAGSAIGFVSGLIGVGGGIFLTPLVILMRWAPAKTAAAISAPFILLNSLAGLAGLRPAAEYFHPLLPWLAAAVLIAGLAGSYWGSHIAASRQVRYALSGVLCLAVAKLLLS